MNTTIADTRRDIDSDLPLGSGHLHVGDVLRNGRFTLHRQIGAGGMGVVFEAFDSERGESVALKTASRWNADRIYRFKNEFRALADFDHPNLCKLQELFFEDNHWCFTMELISGEHFDQWVRPGNVLDEERLRNSITQLCDGLNWMHEMGKVHRDLKPTNVLVTPQGQTVILDFGLTADVAPRSAETTSSEGLLCGTPAYMAPEQISSGTASEASDLYSVGTMLFEALVGRKPYLGSASQILGDKLHLEPPRVASLVSGLPEDLGSICDRLLGKDQSRRPTMREVVEAVAGDSGSRTLKNRVAATRQLSHKLPVGRLLGRKQEQNVLRTAFASCRNWMPTVVFISGEPGMGKTTLVSSFLEEVRVSQDALILRGRCNEREDVPFNAFDALVDDLSRYLRLLPDAETSELLPRDVFALVQLFPVLNRVPAIERAPLHLVNDRSELRTRAFDAFRELIARIGDRRFTCILIDDLQWVDQDSLPLLRSLLVDPEPAPVMLVLSRRSDSREDSDLVSIRHLVDSNSAMESFDLEVAPLTQEDSRALALSELPSGTKDSEALARSIAEEAGGSPLFIQALASSHGMLSGGTSSFDELLNAHRHALQPEARRLLEMVALLGRPVALRPLLSASGAERGVVDQLQAGRLLRADRKSTTVELECYHDRIRESVTAQLSEQERSEHYRYLATALSDSRDSDPELLADCFEGSGQFAEGARSAAMAAARAEQGMAFEKAARLYQRALQLALPSDGQRREHLVSMAEALGNAGRSDAAADAYLQAAALTQGEEAVEWRRRAAFELLTGGYAERGETLIRRVCQEVGIRIPANHRVAVTRYLILQGALRWAKVPPPAAPLRPLTRAQELKLNVAWTATFLSVDDPILGLWAGAQYLREALSAKEPRHIAMALTVEGFNTTMVTPRSEARIAELFAAGESYSRMLGDTALLGALSVNQGVGFIFGRAMSANRGREYLRSGLEQLRGTRGNRVYIDSANMYLMLCPSQDLAYEARRCTLLVEEAFSLKRLWSARHMAVMSVFTRLLVDDYDGVAQHVALASAAWTPERSAKWFDLTMFQALVTMAHYRGDPEVTLHQAERLWPIYEGSGVQKSIIGAALMHAHRGAAAVWVARRPGTSAHRRSGLLRMARRDLRRLSRTPFHPYSGLELAIKTGLALAEGHTDQALALFKQYVDTGKSSPLWAESETYAARRAIGLLIGGAQGEEIVNSAERSLRELGVRKIAASCQMLLPGCHLSIEG